MLLILLNKNALYPKIFIKVNIIKILISIFIKFNLKMLMFNHFNYKIKTKKLLVKVLYFKTK